MLNLWVYYITFFFFSSEYFLVVVGLDSRSKHGTEDGFVTVSLKTDRGIEFLFYVVGFLSIGHLFLDFEHLLLDIWVLGKRSNSQENRNYLRLWTPENKSKSKNAKDLPKLNQVRTWQLNSFISNLEALFSHHRYL